MPKGITKIKNNNIYISLCCPLCEKTFESNDIRQHHKQVGLHMKYSHPEYDTKQAPLGSIKDFVASMDTSRPQNGIKAQMEGSQIQAKIDKQNSDKFNNKNKKISKLPDTCDTCKKYIGESDPCFSRIQIDVGLTLYCSEKCLKIQNTEEDIKIYDMKDTPMFS